MMETKTLLALWLCIAAANASCNGTVSMQAMLALVQHQATTMEQQGAMIQAMQTQLTSLQSKVFEQSNTILELKAKVTDVEKSVTEDLTSLQNRLDAKMKMSQVAFTAHMSTTHVNVGYEGPFIFDVVVTNIGDAYNDNSGIFVAPYDGVYVFFFIMLNDGDAPTIHAAIEKDGHELGRGTSDGLGAYNKWDDGSALATTHLTKGDHVYVKRRTGGTMVYGNVFTTFSGFLLSADA